MSLTNDGDCSVAYRTDSPPIRFAVDQLSTAVSAVSHCDVNHQPISSADVLIIAGTEDAEMFEVGQSIPGSITSEGFEIERFDDGTICVWATDDSGAMYGMLELAEQVRATGGLDSVNERATTPSVKFRAIKFNLPWSPYRGGAQTEIHHETCRDLDFWRKFLDMMAHNRFNVLTLWNLHPFPYMVRTQDFPEASPFSDAELTEWQSFWHELFRMATERGIETYIVNWNILVTEGFAEAHDVERLNDTAEIVREYTRKSITDVLNEYKELTGVGTTMSDWMGAMTPEEKQTWLKETFIEGIAAADRPAAFLDRSVRTNSIDEMRRTIDESAQRENVSQVWVPSKFNWSHGHSTTSLELTHDYRSGEVDDSLWNPKPENYDIVWTVRNEDFFILRWGDPEYVRDHIQKNHQGQPHVGGYILGSEAFIPAKDYSHRLHDHRTWEYAFEKQWLLYAVWGRLLYDLDTPDMVFERLFEKRYGENVSGRLLEGYKLASQMPLELASFHAGTWDYALYAEGFLAPVETMGYDDEISPFISIDEFIRHQTLDSNYSSIPKYVDAKENGGVVDDSQTTPIELADRMESSGDRVLEIVDSLRSDIHDGSGAFECELADLAAWGHLSLYFAKKLRAGVKLETYRITGKRRKDDAVELLRDAAEVWDEIIAVTDDHYRQVPYATDWQEGETFSWKKYRDQVQRDIHIAQASRPNDYENP